MNKVLIALAVAVLAAGPAAATEKSDGIVTLGNPRHADITADRAYVVVPANFTHKRKGKLVKEVGSTLTLSLQQGAADWRISGWAWTKK